MVEPQMISVSKLCGSSVHSLIREVNQAVSLVLAFHSLFIHAGSRNSNWVLE